MGSIPTPNKGYVFVGWYTDVDCTIPVTDDVALVTTTAGTEYGKIVPKNPDVAPDDAIYFYAKFDPYKLTIQNAIGDATVNPPPALDWADQSFIYHIQGVSGTPTAGVDLRVAVLAGQSQTIFGLPAGEYTVTVESEWSWRYKSIDKVNVKQANGSESALVVSDMTWTLDFGGSDVMTVSYGIPAPDVSGTTGSNSYYYITDNAYGN